MDGTALTASIGEFPSDQKEFERAFNQRQSIDLLQLPEKSISHFFSADKSIK